LLNTDDVTDLSPLRVLSSLRALKCSGFGDRNSPLTDLSPLSGLPLRTLVLSRKAEDLTVVAGMSTLEHLSPHTSARSVSSCQRFKVWRMNAFASGGPDSRSLAQTGSSLLSH
jgi:hypothetical protein